MQKAIFLRCLALLVTIPMFPGCDRKPAPTAHRVELREKAGNLIELLPAEGTLPYCLAFSIAERGVVRQLTMGEDDKSLACPPGKPIGNVSFRILPSEGKVRIYVFFSEEKLAAGSLAQQVTELAKSPTFSALDLRVPGKVVSDALDYTPTATPKR